MEYTFLNEQKHYDNLLEIFMGEVKNCEYPDDYEWFAEEQAEQLTERHIEQMDKYVHKSDTKIWGNFCNIREDWNYPGFVHSEVEPWGNFDDVVKSIDDKTISEEDLSKFQQWCEDWFYTAFGTYNLKYNFGTDLDEVIYSDEREREREQQRELAEAVA